MERFISLDLSSIKFKIPDSRSKKGVQKAFSPADLQMMRQTAPTTHGTLIQNEYFMTVRTDFEGCSCMTQQPMARVPILLIPEALPLKKPPIGFIKSQSIIE